MTYRILVIEDDEAHRRTLRRHLERSGYELLTADSGESGLSRIAEFDPHLVLTDINLPGINGFEVMSRIKTARPTQTVVTVTAYDSVQTAIDAMSGGAYDYLVKPLDLDELDALIERALEDYRVAQAAREEDGAANEPVEVADGPILVGCDRQMREIYKTIGAVAASSAPALIRGETGTGKELIARSIHRNSTAKEHPFVPVNCAALPDTLLESELFGHVRGAFTGATTDRKGRFEIAGRGTLFLDEIGDTSLAFQAKLLRVLQEREFYPLGGELPVDARCRILAATNADLEAKVESGEFREDLLFRLRVIEFRVPPLRERRGDIPALVDHVLHRVAGDLGSRVPTVPGNVMDLLIAHEWPGNVRELENAVTRAAVMARGGVLSAQDLGLEARQVETAPPTGVLELDSVERHHIQHVLTHTGGNKSRAASLLGISRPRLNRMIDRLGLPA